MELLACVVNMRRVVWIADAQMACTIHSDRVTSHIRDNSISRATWACMT
jgi:hypothetical protein